MRTPFLGPAYASRILPLSSQKLINLYPELVEVKQGAKDVGAFYATPGLDLKVNIGVGPIRGLHVISGQLIAASGASVYAITAGFGATLIGTLASATGPVRMDDNGSQIFATDNIGGYAINTAAVTNVTLPVSTLVSPVEQDGFMLAVRPGTQQIYQSNFNDATTWSALNFGVASGSGDNCVALGGISRQIWVFKEKTTELWINAGLPGFAFQRLEGVFLNIGIAAQDSVTRVAESLMWLARNEIGQGIVVRTDGYKPTRISTHPIESEIQKYNTISDAVGFAYQQEGHTFYGLTFPSAGTSWFYDTTTSMWHQRAALQNGMFGRHWANCMVQFNGLVMVGDYRNGNIYSFNMDTLSDAGTQRKWLRTWRALPKPSIEPQRFNALQIDMQAGLGVSEVNPNPQCMLRYSDDGGLTWSSERFGAVGPLGNTVQRVKFNRLGSTSRGTGLDRIFELSSTDQFNVGLIGADLS